MRAIGGLWFEWDEEKARRNIEKHGIDFDTAARVFFDPYRVEIYDEDHSSMDEDRYQTIGLVRNILFVVYTERQDKIRLISARRATLREKRMYHDQDRLYP